MYGKWLNTELVNHPELEKPCVKLGYCPYGRKLVGEFLCSDGELSCAERNEAIMYLGNDCPVHYLAEFAKQRS